MYYDFNNRGQKVQNVTVKTPIDIAGDIIHQLSYDDCDPVTVYAPACIMRVLHDIITDELPYPRPEYSETDLLHDPDNPLLVMDVIEDGEACVEPAIRANVVVKGVGDLIYVFEGCADRVMPELEKAYRHILVFDVEDCGVDCCPEQDDKDEDDGVYHLSVHRSDTDDHWVSVSIMSDRPITDRLKKILTEFAEAL